VTRVYSLGALAEHADELEQGAVVLRVDGSTPSKVIENLRRLHRLDLLTDEAIWSLVGQAPVDPLGVYGALRHWGVWAFSPLDFTVVQVLAKKGAMPVAVMRVDLMSNEIVFVALERGQLVARARITPDQLEEKLRDPGTGQAGIRSWLALHIAETVAAGFAAVQ